MPQRSWANQSNWQWQIASNCPLCRFFKMVFKSSCNYCISGEVNVNSMQDMACVFYCWETWTHPWSERTWGSRLCHVGYAIFSDCCSCICRLIWLPWWSSFCRQKRVKTFIVLFSWGLYWKMCLIKLLNVSFHSMYLTFVFITWMACRQISRAWDFVAASLLLSKMQKDLWYILDASTTKTKNVVLACSI